MLARGLKHALKIIVNHINTTTLKKEKHKVFSPFTRHQNEEFEYLSSRLTQEVILTVEYHEHIKLSTKEYSLIDEIEILARLSQKQYIAQYSCQFLDALVSFIERGYSTFHESTFNRFLDEIAHDNPTFPDPEKYDTHILHHKKNYDLLLRTLRLISGNDGKFLTKVYELIHWLEFNGVKASIVEFEKIENGEHGSEV